MQACFHLSAQQRAQQRACFSRVVATVKGQWYVTQVLHFYTISGAFLRDIFSQCPRNVILPTGVALTQDKRKKRWAAKNLLKGEKKTCLLFLILMFQCVIYLKACASVPCDSSWLLIVQDMINHYLNPSLCNCTHPHVTLNYKNVNWPTSELQGTTCFALEQYFDEQVCRILCSECVQNKGQVFCRRLQLSQHSPVNESNTQIHEGRKEKDRRLVFVVEMHLLHPLQNWL